MTHLWCFELIPIHFHYIEKHPYENKILFMEEMTEVSFIGDISLYGLESMRKQNGWLPHLSPEDGGSYLHSATGHLYPRLSAEDPGELCRHFPLRYHDTWSQSMACAYLLLRRKKQEKLVYFLLIKTKPRQQPIILVFCENALCVSTTVRQLKARAQNHTLTSAQWHLPPLFVSSWEHAEAQQLISVDWRLWALKARGQMRCALASDCRNTAAAAAVSVCRGWCEGQIALFNGWSVPVPEMWVHQQLLGERGYSCSADLIVWKPDSEAAAGSRRPQGNKMSSADCWGPCCLTESAAEKHLSKPS